MKPYIDLNIEWRKETVRKSDKVDKNMFKIFDNAVFGKSMENLRKGINFDHISNVRKDFVKIWLEFT